MATASPSIDALSKDERAIIVAALDLKAASVTRAARAESNAAIVEIRSRQHAAIQALIARFS